MKWEIKPYNIFYPLDSIVLKLFKTSFNWIMSIWKHYEQWQVRPSDGRPIVKARLINGAALISAMKKIYKQWKYYEVWRSQHWCHESWAFKGPPAIWRFKQVFGPPKSSPSPTFVTPTKTPKVGAGCFLGVVFCCECSFGMFWERCYKPFGGGFMCQKTIKNHQNNTLWLVCHAFWERFWLYLKTKPKSIPGIGRWSSPAEDKQPQAGSSDVSFRETPRKGATTEESKSGSRVKKVPRGTPPEESKRIKKVPKKPLWVKTQGTFLGLVTTQR